MLDMHLKAALARERDKKRREWRFRQVVQDYSRTKLRVLVRSLESFRRVRQTMKEGI